MKQVKIWAASSGGNATTVQGNWNTFGELKEVVNEYLRDNGKSEINFAIHTAIVKSDKPEMNKMTYESDKTLITAEETKLFLTPRIKAEAGANPNFAVMVGNVNNADDAREIIQALISKFNDSQESCDCSSNKEALRNQIDFLDNVIDSLLENSINDIHKDLSVISESLEEILENLSSEDDRTYRDFIASL